jgi:hypothetical protein
MYLYFEYNLLSVRDDDIRREAHEVCVGQKNVLVFL